MNGARGLRCLWLAAAAAICSGCAARFAEGDGPGGGVASIRASSNMLPLREVEPASEPLSGQATVSDPIAPMDPTSRTMRTLGWIGISVGAEAAIVAVGTSALLLHEKQVRDADCNARRICSSAGVDANGTIGTLVGWNTAAWVVTAAGLAAGGILLAISWRDAQRTTAITVAPTGSGVGLGVRSSF
jgi:hypothetical protein